MGDSGERAYNYCWDTLDVRAEGHPSRTALYSVSHDVSDVDEVTFDTLCAESKRFTGLLAHSGVAKGSRVLVMLPRLPDWYDVILGCIRIGVVPIPTTTMSTVQDIAYRLERSGACAVVCLPSDIATVSAALEERPSLQEAIKHRWVVQDRYHTAISLTAGDKSNGWAEYRDITVSEELQEPSREVLRAKGYSDTLLREPMILYFTSGTTGKPKMVRHDHGYALSFEQPAKDVMLCSEGDVQWSLSDTGWAKTSYGKLYGQWAHGTAVVQYRQEGKFVAEMALRLVERTRVSILCVPPTVYRMFVQLDLAAFNLASVKRCYSAGEPLNPEVIRKWKVATGLDVHEFYGQTETNIIVANVPGAQLKYGSMGKPLEGYRVEVIDEEGNVLPVGEAGHIAVHVEQSKPLGIFMDYWMDDAMTSNAFRCGWYYTQDKGYKDSDGYIWYVGRADDVFKSSGYRIGPFEVESALIEHDAVREAAVVGVPDPEGTRGLLIKAFVILTADYQASQELRQELQEHVKASTAPYKYPRLIDFVEQLPKTISGKIRVCHTSCKASSQSPALCYA